jgi:hypothetical protein
MDKEARAIAGEYCSFASQLADDYYCRGVVGAGIADVVELSSQIATYAARVGSKAVAPPLPIE